MGRYALVLGTATYHVDRDLTALPSVRHDIPQVKAVLDHSGGFDGVESHLDLTRSELTSTIERFFGDRRRGDVALLYYSGHGVLHRDQESLFLAAADTDHEQLHATAVDTAGVLKDMLSRTYATQKVVILDCCFSGAFTAGNRFRGGVREEPRGGLRHAGTFILTSSTHTRASFSQGSDRPSVFTGMLLDGLRGDAHPRGDSSWITTHDLAHFVQAEAPRRGAGRPSESSEGVTEPIGIVTTGSGPATGDPRRSEPAEVWMGPDAPFDADRWRKLIQYYAACIQRSAVLGAFVNLSDRDRYAALPAGPESVFAGEQAAVPASDQLSGWARRAIADGRGLRYGYPIVVQRSAVARDRLQFAALLESDVSLGPDGTLHATLPPRINVPLARDHGLSDTEIDDLTTRFEETFVAGNPVAVATSVQHFATVLGLRPVVPIDPTRLSGIVQSGPLRGVQNAAVLFSVDAGKTPEGQLLEDLRKEIAAKPGQIPSTALGALAGADDATLTDASDLAIVAPDLLNEVQERVIRSAMTRRLTVSQGPPGTGKSQLVTALVATATAAGQTVLVGSTNNPAVNAVTDRCDDLVGPGLIVRSGNKTQLAREPELLVELVRTYATGPPPDSRTPAAELRMLQAEVEQIRSRLDDRRLLERDLAELAAERVDLGAPAVPLPVEESTLRHLVQWADRGRRHRLLGWWSRRRLRAFGVDGEGLDEFAHRVTVELRCRAAMAALEDLPDERDDWQSLRERTEKIRPMIGRELLTALVATRVRAGRGALQRRVEEMSGPKPRSWSGFSELLTTLPAWAVTTLSARRLLPTPALFDLVVIDEAAACDIPSVLPLLFRAKRALIIGDPRQLEPVVTLPADEDLRYQGQAGLDPAWLDARRLMFTRHSAYHAFATAAGAVELLDEHYRCHPDIIAAPNRVVYQGQLLVMTDPARLFPPIDPALTWRHVAGRYTRGSSGSGYNEAEIAATVAEVVRLRAAYPQATVGVVTPLAAQAARVDKGLRRAGLAEDVACGTAHGFQGGERDIMVISAVGASGVATPTRNWLVNRTNLWNVAITRAKDHLLIVGDQSWWAGQSGILAQIAAGHSTDDAETVRPVRAADGLHAAARAAGFAVRRDVLLGGYRYDVVLGWGNAQLAILVDDPAGDPRGRGLRIVLARLEVAGRARPVRRVPAWRCLAEPEAVVVELGAMLRA